MPVSRIRSVAVPIVFPPLLLLLTALIYGRSVNLPLFMDDAPLFRWLESIGGLQAWTAPQAFSFYRPLPFTNFKIFWHLQGHYDPLTLHLFVIVVHLINAALLGLLVRRITQQQWIGIIASALFIVFPFSYQVVTYVTNLFHMALVAGLLAAILLGLQFLDTGSRWSLVAAWFAAFLGNFSHENGVLAPLLVALVLMAITYNEGSFKRNFHKLLWNIIPIGLIAIAYFIAWQHVPKQQDFGRGIEWAGMADKAAYAAQGLVYPFSALVRPLVTSNTFVVPIIAFLSIIVIISVLFLTWRITNHSVLLNLLVSLLWIALSVTPGILLLPAAYWLGSSRLLYLSSIGVVLFWTIWLASLSQHKRLQMVGYAVIALFFIVGAAFTLQGVDRYVRMGNFYRDLIRLIEAHPNSRSLSVNSPSYIAPKEGKSTFLIGAEGASYLAYYLSLTDMLWVNTGSDYPIKGVGFLQTLPATSSESLFANEPWVNWEQLDAELSRVQTVYTLKLSGDRFYPVKVGVKPTDTQIQTPLAQFNKVALLSASLDQNGTILTLHWQTEDELNASPFVHIWCDGKLAAQADGAPLGGMHPFDRWIAGEQWLDYREIGKPCEEIEAINIGLVDPDTGERLHAVLDDGHSVDVIPVHQK